MLKVVGGQTPPYQWTAEHAVLTDSIAVNKIGKRAPHPLEHASRFFLGSMEGVFDSCFGAADDPAFIRIVAIFPVVSTSSMVAPANIPSVRLTVPRFAPM